MSYDGSRKARIRKRDWRLVGGGVEEKSTHLHITCDLYGDVKAYSECLPSKIDCSHDN